MTVLSRLTCGSQLGRHILQYTQRTRTPDTSIWRGLRQPRGRNREGGMNLAPPSSTSPAMAIEAPNANRMGSGLLKSTVFAIGFCGTTFMGTSIWQYERVRHSLEQKSFSGWVTEQWNSMEGWQHKEGDVRQAINRWWNEMSAGQRVFWPLCFINALVFGCWNNPAMQQTMLRYFCSNPAARAVCWPMILSTFSHFAFFHFAMNMYVLHSFSTTTCRDLGQEQFLALYLSGGVLSSLASHAFKVAMRCPGPSLGASGAIMAVLGYFCTRHPDAQLGIIFLPGLNFSADSALKGVMCLDTVGMVMGWRMFDHSAHLGGAVAGLLYAHFGHKYIWANTEPIMKTWHQLRNKYLSTGTSKEGNEQDK